MTTAKNSTTAFLWLHVTDQCQLMCRHCATDSSPEGTHGSMTIADWTRVIDEAADAGVRQVQFVGGEPTLYPGLPTLIAHALSRTLGVEVFSNLVHVTDELWQVFSQPGVSLATSYYSDDAGEHAGITGRPSHARTRANIGKAVELGIPLRAGVIDLGDDQRVEQARAELAELGVTRIGYDRVRALGRGRSCGTAGGAEALCGQCGDGVAAIGPDGEMRPCLFARWVSTGNVRDRTLTELGTDLPEVRAELLADGMPDRRARELVGGPCNPRNDGSDCYPHNE